MTDDNFKMIKSMLNAGVPMSSVHTITGRGGQTIQFIRKAANFEEYRKLTVEFGARHPRNKQVDKKVEPPVHEESLVEVLGNINKTLEKLVQAWESKPAKKGFF